MLSSNPEFPAGPTPDPAFQTWQTIPEQRGLGGGLPSQRSLNSATGHLQWPWAYVVHNSRHLILLQQPTQFEGSHSKINLQTNP